MNTRPATLKTQERDQTKSQIRPPNAGKGRKAGVPNRIGAEVKTMILRALDLVGGEAYLVEQAKTNPTAFMTLLGRILPRETDGKLGGVLQLNVVTGVDREQPP